MSVVFLQPVIKNYPWGNDWFLSSLLGYESQGPQAELWMGAHKAGSSIIETGCEGAGKRLYDYLDENPGFLGFSGADFPFLFKSLAIGEPLSIQCHPNAKQAKIGFESEALVRQKVDRSLWNYQDSNPKAEMLYALTEVTAMCGFRPLEQTIALFSTVCPEFYQDYLSDVGTIAEFFDTLYKLPTSILLEVQRELASHMKCIPCPERDVVKKLFAKYPGDPGVFAPLFLNVIVLSPGQAVYLKPGVLHAYVFGNGIELMNNSDNVLRAGLTSKHMDVNELERVMIKEPYSPVPMESFVDGCGRWFPCEGGFSLCVMDHGVFEVPAGTADTADTADTKGVYMFLCTEGEGCIQTCAGPEKGKVQKYQKGSIFLCSKEYAHCVHSEDSVLYMATEGVWNH